MPISNVIKNKLNKMNRAAQDATLGTRVQSMGYAGSTVITTAQMSASAVIVYNALATDGVFMYQVTRSGSNTAAITGANVKHLRSGGSLTIIPTNSGSLNAGDILNYFIA
jgi:hypothetical protein